MTPIARFHLLRLKFSTSRIQKIRTLSWKEYYSDHSILQMLIFAVNSIISIHDLSRTALRSTKQVLLQYLIVNYTI